MIWFLVAAWFAAYLACGFWWAFGGSDVTPGEMPEDLRRERRRR